MKLIVPRKLLNKFRADCRKAWPMEHGAFLWGLRDDTKTLVMAFKTMECTATEGKLYLTREHYRKSKMAALRKNMEWLGTIHSHPSTKDWLTCCHLSSEDLQSAHAQGEGVCGVVHVFRGGTKTEVAWYPPVPLPEVEYV